MNPYTILGIPVNATEKEIKEAYRKLAKQNHPDLHSDAEREFYEAKMKQINEAYDLALKKAKSETSKDANQSKSYTYDKSNNYNGYNNYYDKYNNYNNNNNYNNYNDYNWKYYYDQQREYERQKYDRYQSASDFAHSRYGTCKLNDLEAEAFAKIMKNAKLIQDILKEISAYTKPMANRSNKIIIRMRKALHEYYDKVENYMRFIGRTNCLITEDYRNILEFIKKMSALDVSYANYLINTFAKVLNEETFPVLKFTDEYQKLANNIALVKANTYGPESTFKVLRFVEANLMGIANRSHLLYMANPMCKKYDNSDEYLNYLASRFYMKSLMESADYDIFATLLQKNAFDDFIKEETSKDNKGPKLKLTKESK